MPSWPEPGGPAALSCLEAIGPGLGDAQAGADGSPLRKRGRGAVTKAPRRPPFPTEHSQVSLGWVWAINKLKRSELDISWLLSLCLFLQAGGGGKLGTVRWTRKDLGDPRSCLSLPCATALPLAGPAWFQ